MEGTFASWLEARLIATGTSQRELNRRLRQKSGASLAWSWVHGKDLPNESNGENVIRLLAEPGTEAAVKLLLEEERADRDEALAEYYREKTPEFDGFAGWLVEALREHGLSRSEFARRLGVSYATIGRWAAQEKRPTDQSRAKVAGVLGIPLADVPRR